MSQFAVNNFLFWFQGYLKAIQNGKNGKLDVAVVSRDLIESGPRVIHQSTKNRKVIDTEDKEEHQERQADGKLVTETKRTVQREEVSITIFIHLRLVTHDTVFHSFCRTIKPCTTFCRPVLPQSETHLNSLLGGL